VRRAADVFVPAHYLAETVSKKYGLRRTPRFMPTPINVPATLDGKAARPTVCYVGRLDRRKRPELFMALARRFPDIDFIVIGEAQNEAYGRELEARFGGADNLSMAGFIDQFSSSRFTDILCTAWIMVNTAAREGLPNVFLEAAAHGCAIVSPHDPDQLTSRFGHRCVDGDFGSAITRLIETDRWRTLGEAGRAHVIETHRPDIAARRHLDAYEARLG